MPAIIKNNIRVKNSDSLEYLISNTPTYFFVSGLDEWEDEQKPPTPIDSYQYEHKVLDDIFALKRVTSKDIVSAVPRTNWKSGVVYDQYDQTINQIDERNPSTGDFYRFYVITNEFNVYKCLSNAYGSESINPPTGADPEPFQTADEYIWKYMYSLKSDDVFSFLTSNWMPCYTTTYNDGSSQWISQLAAVPGSIDNIDVVTAGNGYNDSNEPTIEIEGDGTGAKAEPVVNNVTGQVENIIVINRGENYTYANITVVGGDGTGVSAKPFIASRKGHGADPRNEMGATYMMLKIELDGTEGDVISDNIEYRVSGIVSSPKHISNLSYYIKVETNNCRLFNIGDTLTGTTSEATGNIVNINYIDGILEVSDTVGDFTQDEDVSSNAFNETKMLSIVEEPSSITSAVTDASSYKKTTGELLYIANREKITRLPNQKENIIAILSF